MAVVNLNRCAQASVLTDVLRGQRPMTVSASNECDLRSAPVIGPAEFHNVSHRERAFERSYLLLNIDDCDGEDSTLLA
jgi:hypothetical protein